MFDLKWNINSRKEKEQKLNDALLKSRAVSDIDDFLKPSLEKLYDPFTINQMARAVDRIVNAIYDMEKIIIYGDYDVDGITSTAMLMKFISEFTCNIEYFIPHRVEQGYGLTIDSIDQVLKKKPDLIITVDCGITSLQEVDYINMNKVDVIVTDHHQIGDTLPKAHTVLCCKRMDNTYMNPDLSSSGLTYKLIEAINTKMGLDKDLNEYLQLATLGLVADVVPLIGENRVMVSFGLSYLNHTKIEGLKALFDVSGIKKEERLTPYHLGFIICPRLNATGRMDHANLAVELLLEKSQKRAYELALQFDQLNKDRQEEQNRIFEEVVDTIDNNPTLNSSVLVAGGHGWNHAIIGIVASKISERYNKPVILLDINGNMAKGSARSIDGFNIINAIESCKDYLVKFGGHEKAAGLSINTDNIDIFRHVINEIFNKDHQLRRKEIDIDLLLSYDDINYENIVNLTQLEPFGEKNQRPLFCLEKVTFNNIVKIGKKKNHLKLTGFVDCIAFNSEKASELITENQEYDILFYPTINSWNNKESLQLIIYDFKLSGLDDMKLISAVIVLKDMKNCQSDVREFLKQKLLDCDMVYF
ncbi:MAG: single-stranded-DNA-specific exonuclease RecJ, partial [Clostridia bacterium]|nr:single-stranded-DNA-specific exonuclease RecJ [Clostridia bacterium]